ncbi:lipase family alpha/beta hydrolase [Acinetobacter tianfuensis]|nr:alpha/beta fold hydrolase [Acinetobacter tianfuensis]
MVYGLENKLGTAGYWTLLNREERLQMPHLFKLEPYQPNKKIIVMIHGLASSPETWVSLTNNIMGDAKLREHYQVWQVFYSTNMPIFESRFQIHALLKQAFTQVEPNSVSSHDAVLIGHSMGGVISRLLVSDADINAQAVPLLNYEQNIQLQRNPIIRERFIFKPLPPFSRAIFVAAPHRGSELAETWYVNIAKKLVKLPVSFFEQVDVHLNSKNSTEGMIHSGPDDLRPSSRFMALTQNVQPKSGMIYHSIIGNASKSDDKQNMSDGIVPYASSHLDGAISESILKGGHSIHAEPETLIELRHILHEHLDK